MVVLQNTEFTFFGLMAFANNTLIAAAGHFPGELGHRLIVRICLSMVHTVKSFGLGTLNPKDSRLYKTLSTLNPLNPKF